MRSVQRSAERKLTMERSSNGCMKVYDCGNANVESSQDTQEG
jgi:hypothetical protein